MDRSGGLCTLQQSQKLFFLPSGQHLLEYATAQQGDLASAVTVTSTRTDLAPCKPPASLWFHKYKISPVYLLKVLI